MSVFNQKGQKVVNQNNAARDIIIGSTTESKDVQFAINKLNDSILEIKVMIQNGSIDNVVGKKVIENIKDVSVELAKDKPDGQVVKNSLENIKLFFESIGSATGLITGVMQAIEYIKNTYR